MKAHHIFIASLVSMFIIYGCSKKKSHYGNSNDGSQKSMTQQVEARKLSNSNSDFVAQLSAQNETNPNSKIKATGKVYFKVAKDSSHIYYKINIKNLKNITEAFIHYGAKGYNGPQILRMYPARHTEADSLIGRKFSGTLRTGIIRDENLEEGALGGKKVSDLIRVMRNDSAYVQIDTKYHGKGAIRGPIKKN